MSLADWTGLKSSLGDWLHRGDQTAIAGDLISLFEAEFNNDVRVRSMETETSITSTSGYLVHPVDWVSWKSIKQTYGGITANLPFVSDEIATEKTLADNSSPAKYASVIGSKTYVYPAQNGSIYPTVYYAKLAALSASQTSNWLLAKYPNLYLYGCLSQAEAYNLNDPRMPMWKQFYGDGMEKLLRDSAKARFGNTVLTMRPDISTP
jgi:hypothetical protein